VVVAIVDESGRSEAMLWTSGVDGDRSCGVDGVVPSQLGQMAPTSLW
jgi:hypothetical protein